MRPTNDYGISAWSLISPLGDQHHRQTSASREQAARLPWMLDHSGLSSHPAELGLPGTWGRVVSPLAPLPPHLARHRSRCAELLMAALRPIESALSDAVSAYGSERVAVVLGSSTGGIDATERALRMERECGSMPEDFCFEEAHVYHALIRLVQRHYGLLGPGYVISSACSSGGKAIAAAQRLLDASQVDAVLTGGVDALCEMTLRGFGGLGILSPQGSKPFDATRNGISIGEGASILLVERRTPSPFTLLGVGESSDAYHVTAPHPEGRGARLAMERALTCSGLRARDIDYLNGHGTGTIQNDSTEAQAIMETCGPKARFSSTKDRVGHQLGTAGATEAVFCLNALAHQRLPLNRLPDQIDDSLALQPILHAPTEPPEVNNVLSNSFAFGGSNVSVALGLRACADDEHPGGVETVSVSSGWGLPKRRRDSRPLPGRLYVRATALWAKGYPEADAFFQKRRDENCDVPAAAILQPRPRGRASALTRLFAELYGQLRNSPGGGFDEEQVATVYGSAYGEMGTTVFLLDQMATETTLSPARFQASVHNTAGGQISIATGNRSFSTAIAAGQSTVAMALLDAHCWLERQGGEALVLVADEDGPRRLLRGLSFPALGIGLHLCWAESPPPGALAELRPPSVMPAIDALEGCGPFSDSPAAWGIQLLRQLRAGTPGRVVVGHRWHVELRPLTFTR